VSRIANQTKNRLTRRVPNRSIKTPTWIDKNTGSRWRAPASTPISGAHPKRERIKRDEEDVEVGVAHAEQPGGVDRHGVGKGGGPVPDPDKPTKRQPSGDPRAEQRPQRDENFRSLARLTGKDKPLPRGRDLIKRCERYQARARRLPAASCSGRGESVRRLRTARQRIALGKPKSGI
jgi:hypothetical protein